MMEPLTYDIFHFHHSIKANLRGPAYATPSPFQINAISLILQGRDVIGISKECPARTATYIIPILHRLIPGQQGNTRVLILSPTAEAAEKIYTACERLGEDTGLKSIALYGKSAATQQQKMLRGGIDIIIGRPESILHCLWKGLVNLNSLEVMVIDEADKMADASLLPDIFNILMCVTKKRQTMLFTATMPDVIKRLSRQFLTNPATVKKGLNPTVNPETNRQNPVMQNPKSAAQEPKTAVLTKILGADNHEAVLVYTRTSTSAVRAIMQLVKAGYMVTPLLGIFRESKKSKQLKNGLTGPIIVLVVTNKTASRTDVSTIFRTINIPSKKDSITDSARSGRTGKMDKYGDALTLVTSTNVLNIHALEQMLETPLERLQLQETQ